MALTPFGADRGYRVPAHSRRCFKTGRAFQPGEAFYSVLDRNPDGSLVRQDYAEEVWFGPPPDAFASWRSQMPDANADPRKPADPEEALRVFEGMMACEGPKEPALVFALALWLIRKKRLKIVESGTQAGRNYWIVRASSGSPAFRLESLVLEDEQLARIDAELRSLLDRGVE